ncbi:hypothetical protein CR3_gp168 [Cronobacter phage CR3]|uniref:Uncharacterized protein n=1 Tax=Cronobacter phage CR3 TaxID=1162295 RepID=I1TRL0_9CAUD|nr:hypothetical protein CR3_gp168 [Cronobacter phage CR3]AFH21333.1 hypothetical protein CR3_168 [Cronobacter phage CR3]
MEGFFVVYSANEAATQGRGFWNENRQSWVYLDDATVWEGEPHFVPPSLGNDAAVVPFPEGY